MDSELLLSAGTTLDAFEGGDRRTYFKVEARWQQPLGEGRLRPALMVDGVSYRDDFAPQGRRDEREDRGATLSLALTKRLELFESFAELRIEDNDSSVATEAYLEEVLWLGIARSF